MISTVNENWNPTYFEISSPFNILFCCTSELSPVLTYIFYNSVAQKGGGGGFFESFFGSLLEALEIFLCFDFCPQSSHFPVTWNSDYSPGTVTLWILVRLIVRDAVDSKQCHRKVLFIHFEFTDLKVWTMLYISPVWLLILPSCFPIKRGVWDHTYPSCTLYWQCSSSFELFKFHDFPWLFPWLFQVFHDLRLSCHFQNSSKLSLFQHFFSLKQFNRHKPWRPPKCVPFRPFNFSSWSYVVLSLSSAVTYLSNKSLIFHDFPGPTIKFHDFPGL